MNRIRESNRQIDEIVALADKICDNIDKIIDADTAFCNDACHKLARMRYNMKKYYEDLKEIKRYGI